MTARYIHGIHDESGAEFISVLPGCVTTTEAIGHNPNDTSGKDYKSIADRGHVVVCRLNNGYGSTGTIPLPDQYDDFARRCANFVRATRGCDIFIIGNEPNHGQEWPNGTPITPINYADCFKMCYRAIKDAVPQAQVYLAAVAPWNVQLGDWISYFKIMINGVGIGNFDGFALHTYSHGADPVLVSSDVKMSNPEYANRYWHFRAYRDFMSAIPTGARSLPVIITETNQGDHPWVNDNIGWHEAVYREIDGWNKSAGTQKILFVCSYRWPDYDQWGIEKKHGTQQDMLSGINLRIESPSVQIESEEHKIYIPIVSDDGDIPDPLPEPDLQWDERLTKREVVLSPALVSSGQHYWRLTRGTFYDKDQAQGKVSTFVDVLDEHGNRMVGARVVWSWAGGEERKAIEAKPGEEYGVDFPMYAGGRSYGVRVEGLDGSDSVFGMGLGERVHPPDGTHVCYGFVFEKSIRIPNSHIEPSPPQDKEESMPTNPVSPPKTVPPADQDVSAWFFYRMAKMFGLDSNLALAIFQVESGNRPFAQDGKLLIRFENHIFRRYLGNDAAFARYFAIGPNNTHLFRTASNQDYAPLHTGSNERQLLALEYAKRLNERAAFMSISMGAPQIMGFNYELIGYNSPESMFLEFSDPDIGPLAQTLGFFAYLYNRGGMLSAIRNRDIERIALLYNGEGNVAHYSRLFRDAYKRLTGNLP